MGNVVKRVRIVETELATWTTNDLPSNHWAAQRPGRSGGLYGTQRLWVDQRSAKSLPKPKNRTTVSIQWRERELALPDDSSGWNGKPIPHHAKELNAFRNIPQNTESEHRQGDSGFQDKTVSYSVCVAATNHHRRAHF